MKPNIESNFAGMPAELRKLKRWGPYTLTPRAGKPGKTDKKPKYSTATPDTWVGFDDAVADYKNGGYAGIGLVLTGGIEDHVFIDLDECFAEGVVAPWAQEIVTTVGSYTELSQSGTGLHIVTRGDAGPDWTNNEVGIEVYSGSGGRFLTFSGVTLHNTPAAINKAPADVLAGLRGTYGRVTSTAKKDIPPMPDVLDVADTPALDNIELPPAVRDFLRDGECSSGDRSRSLHSAAVALLSAGLTMQEALSVLVHSNHALEVAMDHRRQDYDRALAYLWEHHCVKAAPKARGLTTDDFEDLSESLDTEDEQPSSASADEFEDASAQTAQPQNPAKAAGAVPKFKFEQLANYMQNRKQRRWLIKNVLPHADLGAVFGESGSGKSFFVLDMVMAIARGETWNGHRVSKGAVAYVVAEGSSGFRDRLSCYCEKHQVDYATTPMHLLDSAPNLLDKDDVKKLLGSLLKIAGLKIVVLDTFAQVTAGANENSGEDMGRALSFAQAISRRTGAMVLLVAHSGKDAGRGLRGWSGIKAALEVEILVERDAADKRKASITKMKDGAGEGNEYAFDLSIVPVGTDEDGDPVTSCVLTHLGGRPKTPTRPKLSPNQKRIFNLICDVHPLVGITFDQAVDTYAAKFRADYNDLKSAKDTARQSLRAAQKSGYITPGEGTTALETI